MPQTRKAFWMDRNSSKDIGRMSNFVILFFYVLKQIILHTHTLLLFCYIPELEINFYHIFNDIPIISRKYC